MKVIRLLAKLCFRWFSKTISVGFQKQSTLFKNWRRKNANWNNWAKAQSTNCTKDLTWPFASSFCSLVPKHFYCTRRIKKRDSSLWLGCNQRRNEASQNDINWYTDGSLLINILCTLHLVILVKSRMWKLGNTFRPLICALFIFLM